MFYNEHTKTHNLISLSERRLRGKLIQIENKELSKSTVVAMLSQTRKGHHVVNKRKKERKNEPQSCEIHDPFEVSEEEKQRLQGSIVFQEKYLEH